MNYLYASVVFSYVVQKVVMIFILWMMQYIARYADFNRY